MAQRCPYRSIFRVFFLHACHLRTQFPWAAPAHGCVWIVFASLTNVAESQLEAKKKAAERALQNADLSHERVPTRYHLHVYLRVSLYPTPLFYLFLTMQLLRGDRHFTIYAGGRIQKACTESRIGFPLTFRNNSLKRPIK